MVISLQIQSWIHGIAAYSFVEYGEEGEAPRRGVRYATMTICGLRVIGNEH